MIIATTTFIINNNMVVEAACVNLCNSNGICNIYGKCECYEGYLGSDCSSRYCPTGIAWADSVTATDTAHAVGTECSNRGECDRSSGECMCMDGFTGNACQRLECNEKCNGNGVCVSMESYAKNYRSHETSESFSYETQWDAHKIYGCICDVGYTGYDCSLMECPLGDDPLTTGQVNEVQMVKCFATSGSFVLYYAGHATLTIQASATPTDIERAFTAIPELGEVEVVYSYGQEACNRFGANVMSIEFKNTFGALAPMVAYEADLNAGGYIEVSADASESITDYVNQAYTPIKGTKENEWCAGRGVCSFTTGVCECFDTNGDEYGSSDGYGSAGTRGECGFAITTIANCPGEIACSGHGMCDAEGLRCYCASGWGGGDCSERTCEKNLAWFDYPLEDELAHKSWVECSNMGICDTGTGECVCAKGFFGSACQYMACGGGTENTCSGHGTCLSMAKLALNADLNGDATSYTYGADPNEASTWDSSRIFGCECDSGYQGYDCAQMMCPHGDDPGTYDDYPELQLFVCIGDEGTFDVTFRQAVLTEIPFDVTRSELEENLESLTTISDVTVTYTGINGVVVDEATTGACELNGDLLISIEFTGVPGDVPDITIDDTAIMISATATQGSITSKTSGSTESNFGVTSKDGTTEVAECNNRGWCNYETGLCMCYNGFTSSDGSGNYGHNNDCGYRKPSGGAFASG